LKLRAGGIAKNAANRSIPNERRGERSCRDFLAGFATQEPNANVESIYRDAAAAPAGWKRPRIGNFDTDSTLLQARPAGIGPFAVGDRAVKFVTG
jgi:hypothetical protein